MVVPQVGRLVATDDPWEPYRLLDPDGLVVEPVSAWFRDLQAAGRSALTARSYGMDLLRWFRFLWASGVSWERATRIEARDFCRWLQVAGKPSRPHWRRRHEPGSAPVIGAASGTAYSASVRAHSETVLRGFYDFCAMRRSVISPAQRGEMGGRSLDLMAYLAPKGNMGTVACQETSGHAQAYGVTR